MPVHDFHPDSGTIQRLVDGELDPSEVRKLVDFAEVQPQHWRTIAMTFIEDQQFRDSFVNFDSNDQSAPSKPTVTTVKSTSPIKTSSGFNFSTLQLLATAAAIAVAATIGFMVGDNNEPIVAQQTNNDGPAMIASAPQDSSPSPLTPAEFEPEFSMELVNVDGEPVGSEVDLYRMQDLQQLTGQRDGEAFSFKQVLPDSGFTDVARDRLSRSGYVIDEDTRYVSGQLEDGRAFVVPVRSYRINTSN